MLYKDECGKERPGQGTVARRTLANKHVIGPGSPGRYSIAVMVDSRHTNTPVITIKAVYHYDSGWV